MSSTEFSYEFNRYLKGPAQPDPRRRTRAAGVARLPQQVAPTQYLTNVHLMA